MALEAVLDAPRFGPTRRSAALTQSSCAVIRRGVCKHLSSQCGVRRLVD